MKNLSLLLLLSILFFASCKDDESAGPSFQELIEGDWEMYSYAKVDCMDESRNVSPILAVDGCVDFLSNICNTMSFDSNGIFTSGDKEDEDDLEMESMFTYTPIPDSSYIFICGNTNLCYKIFYEDEKLFFSADNYGCNDEYVFTRL